MAQPRLRSDELCGKQMLRAKETCARSAGHGDRCRTKTSIEARRANSVRRNAENPGHRREANKRYYSTVHGKGLHLLGMARRRARLKDIPFDLTIEWVELELESAVANGCPYLGIPILLDAGRYDPHCPSIDQFDPGAGYTQDNCLIVSYKANTMKNDCPPWLVEKFGRNVATLRRTRFGSA